jgi:hypothetical protein
MDFKNDYPEYASIERHIRRARIERAATIGTFFAQASVAILRGGKRIADTFGRGLDAERDRRAVEADAFLRRSVPRH